MITERSAKLDITLPKKITRKNEVFYNPVMCFNRDISILLIKALNKKDMQIADPLAASGIRSIRFAKELNPDLIKKIYCNDASSNAVESIKKNFRLNNIADVEVSHKDANIFMLQSYGFDYIDIDPFGSPNEFLNSAIMRLSREGILAVTATDTAALAGSSPKACLRKYWARPYKNHMMHETAIRILIRKVQFVGADYDKALTPIFCYAHEHYYRVFFECQKGKQRVDELLKHHNYLVFNKQVVKISDTNTGTWAGPLWTGNLWKPQLCRKMFDLCDDENKPFLKQIHDESNINAIGFYDIHHLGLKKIPQIDSIISKNISRTHFLGWGLRTKLTQNQLFEILEEQTDNLP